MAEHERPNRPFPLFPMVCTIMNRLLVAKRPQATMRARRRDMKAEASKLALGLNETLDDLCLDKTLKMISLNGLMSLGIAKVGLGETGRVYYGESEPIQETKVFCTPVSLDNHVFDTDCDNLGETSYAGDRFDLSYEYARDSNDYDHDAIENCSRPEPDQFDENGMERVAALGTGTEGWGDPFVKRIPCWDIYIRSKNEIWTLPVRDMSSGAVLRKRSWNGCPGGPYHYLSFFPVPDNALPLAPAHHWLDLHKAQNILLNKLLWQAKNQKNVNWFTPTGKEDAEKMKNAADQEWIPIRDPSGIGVLGTGGIDGKNNGFFLQLRDLASWVWGNIEAIGGLGPQAGTLGQDQLLAQSSSKQLAEMQSEMIRYTRTLMQAIVYYIIDDPMFEKSGMRTIPGTTIEIPWSVSSNSLEHEWSYRDFDIEPYSMQDMSPSETVAAMQTLLQGIVIPLSQLDGKPPDKEAILKSFAKFMPQLSGELEEWTSTILTEEPPEKSGRETRKSPTSHRTYTRQGRPGLTRGGADRQAMLFSMGQDEGPRRMSAGGK